MDTIQKALLLDGWYTDSELYSIVLSGKRGTLLLDEDEDTRSRRRQLAREIRVCFSRMVDLAQAHGVLGCGAGWEAAVRVEEDRVVGVRFSE